MQGTERPIRSRSGFSVLLRDRRGWDWSFGWLFGWCWVATRPVCSDVGLCERGDTLSSVCLRIWNNKPIKLWLSTLKKSHEILFHFSFIRLACVPHFLHWFHSKMKLTKCSTGLSLLIGWFVVILWSSHVALTKIRNFLKEVQEVDPSHFEHVHKKEVPVNSFSVWRFFPADRWGWIMWKLKCRWRTQLNWEQQQKLLRKSWSVVLQETLRL